jgi:DNA-binding NtrC family response regulator
MLQSAVILCDDPRSLQILEPALKELAIEHVICSNEQQALEPILARNCSTLIADFDLPRAEQVIRLAALLPAPQKPMLLALGRRVWPGTGGAFTSGASRILYKPLDPEQLKDALNRQAMPPKPTGADQPDSH